MKFFHIWNSYKDKFLSFSFAWLILAHSFQSIANVELRLDVIGPIIFCCIASIVYRSRLVTVLCSYPFIYFGYFLLWTFVVNLVWSIIYSDVIFIGNTMMYCGIYFFISSLFIYLKDDLKNRLKFLGNLLLISLLIVLFCSTIATENYWRHDIFFNHINKLSRFSLFSLVLIFYLGYRQIVVERQYILGIAASIHLIVITQSKAALFGLIVLLMLGLLLLGKSVFVGVLLGIILHISISALLPKQGVAQNDLMSVVERFKENGKYDNIWNRGYNRIVEYPKYLLLGAGEQYRKRFNLNDYEVHSTILNVLFCYGLVGFILSCKFLLAVFKKWNIGLLLFVPIFLHSMVHNDFKSLHLWLFLITILVLSSVEDAVIKRRVNVI